MQMAGVLPDISVITPSSGGGRPLQPNHCAYYLETKCFFSSGLPKNNSFSNSKLETRPEKLSARSIMVRASGTSGGDPTPLAPLELESPVGQLLWQVLQTHPHLLMATAEQELKNLQRQGDEAKEANRPQSKNLLNAPSSDDVLYKRIAEFKEKERKKALEEIMYCLIVQKFIDNNISMIPKISTLDPAVRVDLLPNQEHKLESVHSPEAFEMVLSHLSLVLGERMTGPLDTLVQISKIKLGKLYAASIMYGYFLRRVDERYQLERSMNTLPDLESKTEKSQGLTVGQQLWDPESLIRIYPEEGVAYTEEKSYKLRSYVMYLDAETLQKYATMRSKKALSVIEKQTQAFYKRGWVGCNE